MDGHGTELADGLHRIEAPLGDRFVACYVITGSRASVLFDTGVDATPRDSIVPYCRSAGIEPGSIRWVVVSHCDVDHMGGDAAVRELLPDASIVAHARDRRLIESVEAIVEERYREFRAGHGIDIDEAMIAWCHEVARAARVDVALEGPTELDLGDRTVRVVPTPGHSDGSISLWDERSRAALVSDAVLGDSVHLADGRPAFPPTYRRPGPYRETIALIRDLRPDLLLTAHEPVMDAAAGAGFLDTSERFADRLEAGALEALAEAPGPLTTRELIDVLAPRMGSWEPAVRMFLANALVGHLEELEAAGRLDRSHEVPERWSAAAGGAA